MANVTLYYKNRDGSVSSNTVPSGDSSYWQGQGWTTAKPSEQPKATPAAAPAVESIPSSAFSNTKVDSKPVAATTPAAAPAAASRGQDSGNAAMLQTLQSMGYTAASLSNKTDTELKAFYDYHTMGIDSPAAHTDTKNQQAAATTPAAAATNATVNATDYAAQKQQLIKDGVLDDATASSLSDSQVGALYTISLYQQMQAKNDAKIAPASLTQAEMDAYFNQAKAAVDPTFAANLSVAQQDLNAALGSLSGDIAYQSQQVTQQQTQEQKDLANQMAEAGTAFGGLRKQAQDKLNASETGLVRSNASIYQNKLQEMAGNYEKSYGSEALKALNIPNMQYAGVKIGYNPYNIASGFGTQEQAKTIAVEQKKKDLEAAGLTQKTAVAQYGAGQNL